MTDYRPPWEHPLGDVFAIPVHIDAEVPAGTTVFDLDPQEPRHVTGVRVHDRGEFQLTDQQIEQVRDHHRAMEERAARALVDYRRLIERLTSEPPTDPCVTGA